MKKLPTLQGMLTLHCVLPNTACKEQAGEVKSNLSSIMCITCCLQMRIDLLHQLVLPLLQLALNAQDVNGSMVCLGNGSVLGYLRTTTQTVR